MICILQLSFLFIPPSWLRTVLREDILPFCVFKDIADRRPVSEITQGMDIRRSCLTEQSGYLALWIIDVSDMEGVPAAVHYAGRLESLLTAGNAGIAFIHDHLLLIIGVGFVRAGMGTALAADAEIPVNPDNTVFILEAGSGRAYLSADGILTLLTHGRQEIQLDVRIYTGRTDGFNRISAGAESYLIIDLAGYLTALAADTAIKLYDKRDFFHDRSSLVISGVLSDGCGSHDLNSLGSSHTPSGAPSSAL